MNCSASGSGAAQQCGGCHAVAGLHQLPCLFMHLAHQPGVSRLCGPDGGGLLDQRIAHRAGTEFCHRIQRVCFRLRAAAAYSAQIGLRLRHQRGRIQITLARAGQAGGRRLGVRRGAGGQQRGHHQFFCDHQSSLHTYCM
ncbi:hypothetical protein [Duganella sp. P38]|uniref:hypothetical protein n=1 Tax=Duganella sp. P38 TaxID=3423949 RepID=UPI003D7B337F